MLGSASAPATIIEYISLTCPICQAFHLTTYDRVKKELIDTGKVRFIIREYPIGRSAGAAAIIARCAPEKDFFVLYDKFLRQQNKWISQKVRPDAIYKIAAQTGMTREAFDACLVDKTIEDGLRTVKQRGREFAIGGTAKFFNNAKKAQDAVAVEQIKPMPGARSK